MLLTYTISSADRLANLFFFTIHQRMGVRLANSQVKGFERVICSNKRVKRSKTVYAGYIAVTTYLFTLLSSSVHILNKKLENEGLQTFRITNRNYIAIAPLNHMKSLIIRPVSEKTLAKKSSLCIVRNEFKQNVTEPISGAGQCNA